MVTVIGEFSYCDLTTLNDSTSLVKIVLVRPIVNSFYNKEGELLNWDHEFYTSTLKWIDHLQKIDKTTQNNSDFLLGVGKL